MKLLKLETASLDENGDVSVLTTDDKHAYLQLPITPDSQNTLDDEPLDNATAKAMQVELDEYFGKGSQTLARLCYAGGQLYTSYTEEDGVYTTDTGDEFVEGYASDYYNVEYYQPNNF